MNWGKLFKAAWKAVRAALLAGPRIVKWVVALGPRVREWWNGRKVAVIGPTAVGKNCLYHRLKDEPIPAEHNQTKGPERIPKFHFRSALPDSRQFEVTFKRCLNVGGEMEQRDRYWLDACDDADVIFYMITLEDLKNGSFREGSRIYSDLQWVATHMPKMKPNVLVHILVNKIDMELEHGEDYEVLVAELQPHLDGLEGMAKALFGAYQTKLTGLSPTTMKDDHLFAVSFAKALEAVYEAVHPR